MAAAHGPASLLVRRAATASDTSAPSLATNSHSVGAAAPVRASGVVISTGSGFQDGGPGTTVERSRWSTSRPQTIHPQGSVVGADGISSDRPASAAQATNTCDVRATLVRRRVAGAEASYGISIDHTERPNVPLTAERQRLTRTVFLWVFVLPAASVVVRANERSVRALALRLAKP